MHKKGKIVVSSVNPSQEKCERRLWTESEDNQLRALVSEYGAERWGRLAKHFEGRSGKNLRARYIQHLRPGINKEPFSAEERSQVIAFQAIHGNKWSELNKQMPDRTVSQISNVWVSLLSKGEAVEIEMSRRDVRKPIPQRKSWDKSEDRLLEKLVQKYGPKRWSRLAHCFVGQTGKSLRGRYYDVLNKGDASPFSLDECAKVISLQAIHGNRWAKICKLMPNRSARQISNFWHSRSQAKSSLLLSAFSAGQFVHSPGEKDSDATTRH